MHVIFRRLGAAGLIYCLLCVTSVLADGLEAEVDRTRLAEGETLVLSLSAPGSISGTPNLTPLGKDFELLNSSQNSHLSIINGKASSHKDWKLVLAPKRTGKLEIPSLWLGQLSSPVLSVEVLPAEQAAKLGDPQPLLLEVEVTPEDPYVQSKVIYTLRVLTHVTLQQASLSIPKIDDAIVESLGQDKEYSIYRNNHRYQVIERQYALFPQHSGKLEIAAPVLSAQVPESDQQGQSLRQRMFGSSDPYSRLGGLFQRFRPVQVRGRSLSLEVRPQPANTSSPWLPAESLSMEESWSPDPPVFRVGKPVTRTITVKARGLSDAQLPDLPLTAPDGIKLYPDKWDSEKSPNGNTLVARKTNKSVFLPSRSGDFTLPEVRLDWWDIQANQQKTAILPARKIHVLPGTAGASETQTIPPSGNPVPQTARNPEPKTTESLASDNWISPINLARLGQDLIQRSTFSAGYWPWFSALLALGWLITTVLWLRARKLGGSGRGVQRQAQASSATRPSPDKALTRLQRACLANEPKAARKALLEWAEARWPDDPPQRLEALGTRLDDQAVSLLRLLDQTLYATATQDWDGSGFWRRLAPSLKAGKSREKTISGSALPPLYPQTG